MNWDLHICLLFICFAWVMFPLPTAPFCDALAVAVYLQIVVPCLHDLLGILPMRYTMWQLVVYGLLL